MGAETAPPMRRAAGASCDDRGRLLATLQQGRLSVAAVLAKRTDPEKRPVLRL